MDSDSGLSPALRTTASKELPFRLTMSAHPIRHPIRIELSRLLVSALCCCISDTLPWLWRQRLPSLALAYNIAADEKYVSGEPE
ncbi:hypothetical protein ABEB22_16095 (plasmid) [Thioclava sp. 'Guangxiensis']|uniref:hypothetical protein n=1 Tax=Thioclava sp. 'Guangxiensis' TaxID=3149044 RepID=UPI0032C4AC9E